MATLAAARRALVVPPKFEWFKDLEEAAPANVVDLAATMMISVKDIHMEPIVEFVEHPSLLARPRLFPRQKTILKLFFLEGESLNDYDHNVLGEWIETMQGEGIVEGTTFDITKRISRLNALGYDHFPEFMWIGGRRGSKNHIGALILARMARRLQLMRCPQAVYGIDPNKTIRCLLSATNWDQAKANQFADVSNVIRYAPVFEGTFLEPQSSRIFLRTEFDKSLSPAAEGRGREVASIVLEAVPSNAPAARGVAAWAEVFDEQAHALIGKGMGPREAEEVYHALIPALDQMKRVGSKKDENGKNILVDDKLIFTPTSPYQRIGVTYENWVDAFSVDGEGLPNNPDMLALQLSSYGAYAGWDEEEAVGGKQWLFEKAPQMYDDVAKRQQRRNPQKFSIEQLAQWADVVANYLPPALIRKVFSAIDLPPGEMSEPCKLCDFSGDHRHILESERGFLSRSYRCHIDAASSQAGFAAMIAHAEPVYDMDTQQVWLYVIIDKIMRWDPASYQDHLIPYMQVESELLDELKQFHTLESVTFDQYGGFAVRAVMRMDLDTVGLGHVRVREIPFNEKQNRIRWENFKDAAGMGWVRSYRDSFWEGDETASQLEIELRYLQDVRGKIGHPDVGPVQTDDLAVCLAELTNQLLAEQLVNMDMKERLSLTPAFGSPGGYNTRMDPAGAPQVATAPRRRTNARERLDAWAESERQRRGPVPPGWSRGLSRWGRPWR